MLLPAGDSRRQLQLHDQRSHKLRPSLDLRRACGNVVGEVNRGGQVDLVAAVVRPDEYIARDDGHDLQEYWEDGEWSPLVAWWDLRIDRVFNLC